LIDPNLKEIVVQDEIIGYNQCDSKKQTNQKAKKNEKKPQEMDFGNIKYIYFLAIKYSDESEKRNDNREERGGRGGREGRGRGNRGNYQGYDKRNYQGNEGGYYQGNEGGYYY
jgi:hypothetical protein